MIAARKVTWYCLLGCLAFVNEEIWAQPAPAGDVAQASPDLSTPAMKYFGRGRQTALPQPRRRRPAPPIRPLQLDAGKPFQHINKGPSVTPYLSLDTLESANGVPNYYSRVLPQIQQQQVSQAQAAQLRRLQQQLRTARTPGAVATTRNGGVPTTGHSSQFLNSGSYFPPIR